LLTAVGGVKGIATNTNAAAGNVDEYSESVPQNVAAAASATYQDTATISLAAGDWDVTGIWEGTGLSASTLMHVGLSIGTAGNAFSDEVEGSNNAKSYVVNTTQQTLVVPNWRLSLAVTTTVRMKTSYTYSGGSIATYGRISARRRQPGA
jgi:hypothetical protein